MSVCPNMFRKGRLPSGSVGEGLFSEHGDLTSGYPTEGGVSASLGDYELPVFKAP